MKTLLILALLVSPSAFAGECGARLLDVEPGEGALAFAGRVGDAREAGAQQRFGGEFAAGDQHGRGGGAEHGGGQACTGASKCLDHEITPLVWGVMGRIR